MTRLSEPTRSILPTIRTCEKPSLPVSMLRSRTQVSPGTNVGAGKISGSAAQAASESEQSCAPTRKIAAHATENLIGAPQPRCADHLVAHRTQINLQALFRHRLRRIGSSGSATAYDANLRPHAPASFAYFHAVSTRPGTRAACSAAWGLLAVPSRTRPTMPCRMPARRKAL